MHHHFVLCEMVDGWMVGWVRSVVVVCVCSLVGTSS